MLRKFEIFAIVWHILYTLDSPDSCPEVQLLAMRKLVTVASECAQYYFMGVTASNTANFAIGYYCGWDIVASMANHNDSRIRRAFKALRNAFASDPVFPTPQGETHDNELIDKFDLMSQAVPLPDAPPPKFEDELCGPGQGLQALLSPGGQDESTMVQRMSFVSIN